VFTENAATVRMVASAIRVDIWTDACHASNLSGVGGRSFDVEDEFVDRFEELYRVGYRAAFAILGNRHEAEECAQEALARLLARWLRVRAYASPWVVRVATNLALDRVRARKRAEGRCPRSSEDAAEELADRRRDLGVALAALPRRQREAVVLRYLVDLSERDTATAMGCSVGTVKSTVARALERMKTELGPAWQGSR
jgi:RNA polymerase sigma factor (sigma-70 family)